MEPELPGPVTVLNDADAAGLAEARYGAGRGPARAGHRGHLRHRHRHRADQRRQARSATPSSATSSSTGTTPRRRAAASARERDGLSWEQWAKRASKYLRTLENLLWPELFILGGGISKKPEKWVPLLKNRTPAGRRPADQQRGNRRRRAGRQRGSGRAAESRSGPPRTTHDARPGLIARPRPRVSADRRRTRGDRRDARRVRLRLRAGPPLAQSVVPRPWPPLHWSSRSPAGHTVLRVRIHAFGQPRPTSDASGTDCRPRRPRGHPTQGTRWALNAAKGHQWQAQHLPQLDTIP